MKILNNFEQNTDAWLEARRGKITGSRLKDIVVKRGTKEKIGYYQMIAERVAVEPDGENPMERGHRLEEEAIKKFEEVTGKEVQSVGMWVRDDYAEIAISPDGMISEEEAVEVKCLASARHLEAYFTNEVPTDFEMQKLQYFIVNDNLKKLNFVFYDPRIPSKDMFVIEVYREDLEEDIKKYYEYQVDKIKSIREKINHLTF